MVFVMEGTYSKARREELAAFLRSRRERVTPADVGLAPGLRRRTPGLRREEVAQLAGVGVTWYTWLEQGRPINASKQVLDAIADVLRLGSSERWHLYRLAELPGVPTPKSTYAVPSDVVAVLDALDPAPACVYNGKYDLLACNESYAALFPTLTTATGMERNALWQIYGKPGRAPLTDAEVCRSMVATLRTNYANHVGEPEWIELIEALCAANAEFAGLWSEHPVAEPSGPVTKAFECFGLGTVRVRATGFPLQRTVDGRMVVYLPETAADAALIAELRHRLAARRLQPA
jgi:transcriptional regulator with XRE-family HTH domain